MAVTSPILINNPAIQTQSNLVRGVLGPYVYGAKAYVILLSTFPDTRAIAYKSTDGQQTWVAQDSGNEPAFDSLNSVTERAGLITVIVDINPATLAFVQFDTATDTWGTITTHSADFTFAVSVELAGSTAVIYGRVDDPTTQSLYISFITSGAWGAESLLLSAAPGILLIPQAVCAEASRINLMYTDEQASVPGSENLNYAEVSLAGVAITQQFIDGPIDTGSFKITAMLEWNDSLIVPVIDDPLGNPQAFFWQGSPVSAPVWVKMAIHGALAGVSDSRAFPLEITPSEMRFYFGRYDTSPNPAINTIWQVSFDGATLAAPAVYWDEITFPPPNVGAFTVGATAPGGRLINQTVELYSDQDNVDGFVNTYLLIGSQRGYRNRYY